VTNKITDIIIALLIIAPLIYSIYGLMKLAFLDLPKKSFNISMIAKYAIVVLLISIVLFLILFIVFVFIFPDVEMPIIFEWARRVMAA
jgi:hypothetical protein